MVVSYGQESWSRVADVEYEKKVLEPYQHYWVLFPKEREVWDKFVKVINFWLCIPEEKVDKIRLIGEKFYGAMMIADHVEETQRFRKGQEATHITWTFPVTINTCQYLYLIIIDEVDDLGSSKATEFNLDEMLDVFRARALEIEWKRTCQCPTEEEYKENIIRKCCGLFGHISDIMQIFSNKSELDLRPINEKIALFYWIMNDYSTMTSKEGEDITETLSDLESGKYNFLLIHAIQSSSSSEEIRNMLVERSQKREVRDYCKRLLKESGTYAYVENVLKKLEADIRSEAVKLGANPHLDGFIKQIKLALD